MKKVLFLIVTLVCAVTGAWADTDVSLSGGTLTIRTTDANTLSGQTFTDEQKRATSLVLIGKFNAADLQKIQTSGNDFKFTSVDLSQAKTVDNYNYSGQLPNGAVSGYEWFKTEATGNNTTKAIVGGDLYKASVATKNEWTEEDYHHWEANPVYGSKDDLDAAASTAPDGSHALVPQGNVTYNYCYCDGNNFTVQQNPNEDDYEIVPFTENVQHMYTNQYKGKYVKIYASSNNFKQYKLVSVPLSLSWGDPLTDKTHETLSYVYANQTALLGNTSASDGQYAVVGGNEYVYDGSSWVLASSATSIVNPQLMKFTYWSGSLQTAILPAAITAAELPNDVLQNCNSLTRLESGETYAVIQNNNGRRATIYTFEDTENKRVMDILKLNGYVDQNNFTQARPETTDYIKKVNTTDDFYTVHVTGPGRIKWLLAEANVPAGAVLKFDSECTDFTAEDLAALAGLTDQNNNSTNFNKYYVDLYDVAYSGTEDAIKGAIDIMREKNWQYKGLLLPKDPEKVGTSLIADRAADNQKLATCSEFIAYNNGTTTVMHIYSGDQNAKVADYNSQFGTLKSMTDRHNGTNDIGRTEQYIISTNCKEKLTVSALPATATVIMTTNNDMVNTPVGNVKMFVKSVDVGDFAAAVDNTNMQNTNIDQVEIEGRVDADDILSINDFLHGPAELIMKEITYVGTVSKEVEGQTVEVTTPIKNVLSGLTNTSLQYILLPAGLSKDDVCEANYSDLTALKAVVSSSNTNLVAYVAEAGSLVNARLLAANATGDNPPTLGLTTVTLGGNLNNMDINSKDNGGALYSEAATIIHMDLQDAVFADNSHMNFVTAGYASNNPVLADVDLPDDETMEEIPTNCFKGVKSLREVCIPYCYKTIHRGAFELTQVNHITTTDANGALIDNGDKTYTLSAQIEQLGDPTGSDYVFPEHTGVAEVYCLATNVPKCYSRSFPHQVTYGNGGEDQSKVYCRERYINDNSGSGDLSQMIAVLRYPSFESFKNASSEDEEPTYEDYVENLKKYYTDPYREYSKKDQTGAIDADGKPLLWPTHEEMDISESSATAGNIWKDYTFNYDNKGEIKSANVSISDKHYDFTEYIGWHEFVLTQATYVKPDEHVVDDVVYNYYKDAGWYTICIPFDLSYNDVVKMLGVPKSTAKEKSYIVENGVAKDTDETDDVMPDIRQLLSVERKKGSGSQNNEIVFRLTTNLALPSENTANYLDFSEGKVVSPMPKAKKEGESADNSTCMVGGRPYIIKAYKRTYKNGESFVDETIPSQNIGLYILKHYADDFKESASCLNNDGYYEQLKTYKYELDGSKSKYIINGTDDDLKTMKFAKPYEDHKVQAVNGGESGGALSFKDGEKTKKYFYTMVGQFWDQDLPRYSVYMSNGKWYRYTDPSRNYKWAAYKCVIMATPEVDQEAINNFKDDDLPDAEEVMDQVWTSSEDKPAMPKIPVASLQPGGNFRYFKNCFFPMNMPGTKDLISAPLKLAFFGRDDHDFNVPGHHQVGFPAPTRYMFVLDGDEDVVEYDENGNAVTAIATLDGEVQSTAGTSKVYNLSGQYVGNSTEGLSKGIYIVDGRKIVVD